MMENLTTNMDATMQYIYAEIVQPWMPAYFEQFEYTPWVFSLIGSALIGLSGILPLFVIPDLGDAAASKEPFNPSESKSLKILLSFAVGGLLGDVFLHLLPEAWGSDAAAGPHSLRSGLWVLGGILIFTIVEKIFSEFVQPDGGEPRPRCVNIANCLMRRRDATAAAAGGDGAAVSSATAAAAADGDASTCGGAGACDIEDVPGGCFLAGQEAEKTPAIKVAGYLNLLANSIDNFTHGLAVAGSFLVSFRHGVLGTFAILLHEIPHEVGDFAILLKSGFNRWDAAKLQLLTAGAGILGALVAIGGSGVTSAMEARTSWIMPFTAGGFLHIALITVLPDLLKETDPRESLKQLLALLAGIGVMAVMTVLFES